MHCIAHAVFRLSGIKKSFRLQLTQCLQPFVLGPNSSWRTLSWCARAGLLGLGTSAAIVTYTSVLTLGPLVFFVVLNLFGMLTLSGIRLFANASAAALIPPDLDGIALFISCVLTSYLVTVLQGSSQQVLSQINRLFLRYPFSCKCRRFRSSAAHLMARV